MLKIINKIHIKNLLLMSFFFVSLAIILIISISFYLSTVSITSRQINENVKTRLGDVNTRLNNTINQNVNMCFSMCSDETIIGKIRNFAGASLIEQLDIEKETTDIIHNYWRFKQEISNINLILEGKKSVTSYQMSILPLEAVEESEWFRKIEGAPSFLNAHNRISDAYKRNENETLEIITILSRIYGVDNSTLGYICIDISKDYLYRSFLQPNKATSASTILVIDSTGKIVLSDGIYELDIPELQAAIEYKEDGFKRIKYKNKSHLLFFSETDTQGWKTVELIPTDSLYTTTGSISAISFTTIIISLILALLMSMFLSLVISGPITRLADTMRDFQKNNLKKRVENNLGNEIGILNTSYNAMLDTIEMLFSEVALKTELKKHTEIMALQSQINPHFLYNALNSISWYAIKRQVPEISDMLEKLVQIYRYNLYTGVDYCKISEELSQIELYMDLQIQCFHERFSYNITADDSVTDRNIPKFIIQPIVENCINHAFSGMEKKGVIEISVGLGEDDYIQIEISDNGEDVTEEILYNLNNNVRKGDSYGIYNVVERLTLICSDSTIKFSRNKYGGMTAKIAYKGEDDVQTFDN